MVTLSCPAFGKLHFARELLAAAAGRPDGRFGRRGLPPGAFAQSTERDVPAANGHAVQDPPVRELWAFLHLPVKARKDQRCALPPTVTGTLDAVRPG